MPVSAPLPLKGAGIRRAGRPSPGCTQDPAALIEFGGVLMANGARADLRPRHRGALVYVSEATWRKVEEIAARRGVAPEWAAARMVELFVAGSFVREGVPESALDQQLSDGSAQER